MKAAKLLLIGLALALTLTACGGSKGGDEPTDVVKKAVKSSVKMDLDGAAKYVCQAQRDEFELDFDLFSILDAMLDAELDPDDVLDAIKKIKLEDMEYEETKDDDQAVVHVEGTMKVELDQDKFKELVKAAGESGPPISDEKIDSGLDILAGMLSQGMPIDDDIPLIKEDDKWVICPQE